MGRYSSALAARRRKVSHYWRGRKALAGVVDGVLKDISECHRPMSAQQIMPTTHRSRNGYGVRMVRVHFLPAERANPIQREGLRRPPAAVQGGNLFRFGVEVEREAITADAAGAGIHHVHHGGCGDGGVGCRRMLRPAWAARGLLAPTRPRRALIIERRDLKSKDMVFMRAPRGRLILAYCLLMRIVRARRKLLGSGE